MNAVRACSQLALLGPRAYCAMQRAKKAYRKLHPVCEVTGWPKAEVHHKKSVHLAPALAADPGNFITLGVGVDLHLLVGHCGNFKQENEAVASDGHILGLIFAKILGHDGPEPRA